AAHRLGESGRECRHANGMARRCWIAHVDSVDSGFYKILKNSLDPDVEAGVLDRECRLTRERARHAYFAIRIGLRVAFRIFLGADRGDWIRSAVDEEDHAEHAIEMIDHRDDHHRSYPVSIAHLD